MRTPRPESCSGGPVGTDSGSSPHMWQDRVPARPKLSTTCGRHKKGPRSSNWLRSVGQWGGGSGRRTPVEGVPGQSGVSRGAEEGMCRAYSRTKDQVSALVRGWEGPLGSKAAR